MEPFTPTSTDRPATSPFSGWHEVPRSTTCGENHGALRATRYTSDPATLGSTTIQNPQSKIKNRRVRAAFTLSEVLVALGILALGTVAVASLFPTAAFLQKEAVKETLRQNHTRSADAVLEGVGINNTVLLNFVRLVEQEDLANSTAYPPVAARAGIDEPAYDVFALAEVDLTTDSDPDPENIVLDRTFGGAPPDMRRGMIETNGSYVYDTSIYPDGPFPVAFRSLPTTTPKNASTGYAEREVFWVALIRAGVEASEIFPDWSVYAFILQPDSQLREPDPPTRPLPAYADAYYPAAFDGLVCANPDSAADYFPKVFRVPATLATNSLKIDAAEPQRIIETTIDLFGYVKPGEKMLGDNGVIYRVSQIDADTMPPHRIILATDTEYAPIDIRPLGAVWVAPAPGGINQDSPLADIKLLSNTVVRTNDF